MRLAGALAVAGTAAVAAAAAWWLATAARAGDAPTTIDAGGAAPHPLTVAVAAGQHWRLDSDHGAVHVWVPAGFHADGAATVVYVHGYRTDVDDAWTAHHLPEQFALSGIDAMFVACEAPARDRDAVSWRSLGELLATVHAGTGLPRPMGLVAVAGHSGAYRTLREWLDDPFLDVVMLLDANYGETAAFSEWLAAGPRRRLIDVTQDTVRWSEDLARDTGAVVVEGVPADEREWPAAVRDARAVMVRAQVGHMGIVTGGVALPLLLRLLPVEVLAEAPWAEPLGALP